MPSSAGSISISLNFLGGECTADLNLVVLWSLIPNRHVPVKDSGMSDKNLNTYYNRHVGSGSGFGSSNYFY